MCVCVRVFMCIARRRHTIRHVAKRWRLNARDAKWYRLYKHAEMLKCSKSALHIFENIKCKFYIEYVFLNSLERSKHIICTKRGKYINLRSMACVVGVLIYNSNLHVHEFNEGVREGCCDLLHIFSLVSSTSQL